MQQRVLVSVVMITYGHEKYIRQAIEGVLMQEGDFDLELIVANDCSPDATDAVVHTILKEHPRASCVRYFKHEENKGMMANFVFALQQATGKYIALCDGDDYWTDPYKLQKQVQFLEENEEYVIHSGKAQMLVQNELSEVIGNPLLKSTYVLSDFFTKNNLISCTTMFKNKKIKYECFENLIFGDWILSVLLLSNKKGNLAYVSDEIYAVYRVQEGGVMQTLTNHYDNQLAHLKQIVAINKAVNTNYNEDDIKKINFYCLSIFRHSLINKKYKVCFSVFVKNFFLTKNRMQIRKYLSFIKNNLFISKHA